MDSFSNYRQSLRFLFSRINYERISTSETSKQGFQLGRMHDLLSRLGNPHLEQRIIHVAGSKGKGSTAGMIASILQSAGYRTALFSSPHLYRIEERFSINKHPASTAQFTELITHIRPHVEQMDRESVGPTYFEITTAMAFLHFSNNLADATVLEVGLGGRLDSTNVCLPELAVITSISRDHTRQLGSRLEDIAKEKAGIVKPGIPVISGVTNPPARKAISEICAIRKASLRELNKDFSYHCCEPHAFKTAQLQEVVADSRPSPRPMTFFTEFDLKTWRNHWTGLQVPLLGAHQAANAAVAIAAIETLQENNWSITKQEIRNGLENTRLPIRAEVLKTHPAIIVDASHNDASIAALTQTLDTSFSPEKQLLIFAATQEKDISIMLEQLLPRFQKVILTQYQNNPRAVPVEQLAELTKRLSDTEFTVCYHPRHAWNHAKQGLGPQDLLCVTGSFFIAAEMRHWILKDKEFFTETNYPVPHFPNILRTRKQT